ncbi:MAG: hypothetical protein IJQ80_02280, partial [Clostridia bacterium]|nr:hypothetical protein [Clostridia bacterium]
MKKVLSIVLVLLSLALILTACGNGKKAEPTQQIVDDAADMFVDLNKPGTNNVVAANFKLPSKIVDFEGYDFDVKWTVEGANGLVSVEDGEYEATVKVNKYADNDTEFTLKGTVSCGKVSNDSKVAFKYVIKQYVISDWAYWADNTKGATMNIKGVVVAKYPYSAENKNTGVFIQDLDGEHGYFAYRLKCDSQAAYDNDLAIGNVLEINGTTSIYNGFREMGAGCTYDVVKNEDGTTMTAEVKKVALDDLVTKSASLAAALDQYQGMVGTLTGFKIKSIDWNTNNADTYKEKGAGSVYVTVTKDGKDLKLYLSTSNQLTLDDLISEYEKLGVGYTVNVEGPITWYNEPQMYPCKGGITVTSTEVTAADKLTTELKGLTLPANVTEETTITLPATGAEYDDVVFAWSVEADGTSAKIEDDKLILTPTEGTVNAVVKVVATCGDATETKEFQVAIVVGDPSYEDIVNSLYTLEKGQSLEGTYRLYGEIVKIDTPYSEQYGNITVTIVVEGLTEKPVQCFRMKGEGAEELKVGDKITVEGKLKRYNDTFEFDTGCAYVGQGEIIAPEKIVKAAYRLEAGATMENVTLTGVITTVNTAYSEQYGNITVTIVVDDLTDYPIQCFRAKGAEGVDISGLAVGDTITVT